jgi:transcriptional regulator with XRE-family HTH domain
MDNKIMDTVTIGERLKQLRKHENLTQADFASKIKLTHSIVSLIESGKRQLTEQSLHIICLTFGVNENWLLSGSGEMFDNESDPPELENLVEICRQLDKETVRQIIEYARLLLRHYKERTGQALQSEYTTPPPEKEDNKSDFLLEPICSDEKATPSDFEEDKTAG